MLSLYITYIKMYIFIYLCIYYSVCLQNNETCKVILTHVFKDWSNCIKPDRESSKIQQLLLKAHL